VPGSQHIDGQILRHGHKPCLYRGSIDKLLSDLPGSKQNLLDYIFGLDSPAHNAEGYGIQLAAVGYAEG